MASFLLWKLVCNFPSDCRYIDDVFALEYSVFFMYVHEDDCKGQNGHQISPDCTSNISLRVDFLQVSVASYFVFLRSILLKISVKFSNGKNFLRLKESINAVRNWCELVRKSDDLSRLFPCPETGDIFYVPLSGNCWLRTRISCSQALMIAKVHFLRSWKVKTVQSQRPRFPSTCWLNPRGTSNRFLRSIYWFRQHSNSGIAARSLNLQKILHYLGYVSKSIRWILKSVAPFTRVSVATLRRKAESIGIWI